MRTLEGFPGPLAPDSAGRPAPSTRLLRGALAGLLAVAALLPMSERAAHAQPMFGGGGPPGGGGMPDLRMMNGRPLPDQGLAAGTITVRVARKMPVNAVVGATVTATITSAGGDAKKRTATTDSSGRATFEGIGAGNQFRAEVSVDGETIKTTEFEVPAAGGIRTMLIAGLGAAPAGSGDAAPMAGGPPGGGRGMPDLRMMNGRPLPDAGLAAGTVSVRVARKMPVNAVVGTEVTALVTNAGGETKKRTATTDASGRAIFEAVGAGNRFQAEVKVDGETIKSSLITVPPTGGVRTMLIAGLGPAPAGGQGDDQGEGGEAAEGGGGSASENFLGASTAAAMPAPDLPAKTLEVRTLDENGRPLPNMTVQLGTAAPGGEGKLQVTRIVTNAQGIARFTGLATGATVGYAAVVDYHGMRLGTQPFTMPETGGVRADIRALPRTSDPSIISIGSGGRVVLQMHDDVLQILEMLPIENRTDKLFDPGPGGVEIPLPKGFVNAEAGESDRGKLEIRKNYGIAVHGPIAPTRGNGGANNEITFAFTVPYYGSTYDFHQLMSNGLGATTLIVEEHGNLSVEGPGIGARQERELNGHKYWVMPIEAIAPGQKLSFLVTGLPAPDYTGRIASGTLALLLVVASVVFGRKPAGGRNQLVADRDRLMERREALFQQLVEAERERRTQTGAGADGAKDRRNQLVAKLESVYRDLAALDEPRAT
jgi:hypothetical protein